MANLSTSKIFGDLKVAGRLFVDFIKGDLDVEGQLSESGNRVATRNWTNNNADVPNADYADSAGDADTVDGEHASAFVTSSHNHDGRYARLYDGVQAPVYASQSDVPSGITEGELVYVSGDGLYVEDGT